MKIGEGRENFSGEKLFPPFPKPAGAEPVPPFPKFFCVSAPCSRAFLLAEMVFLFRFSIRFVSGCCLFHPPFFGVDRL